MIKELFRYFKSYIKSVFGRACKQNTAPIENVDFEGISPLSQNIFYNYQPRKTKKQKNCFVELLKNYADVIEERSKLFPFNNNLILGDVKNAKVIFTAHYDTSTQLILPNFNAPTKPVMTGLFHVFAFSSYIIFALFCVGYAQVVWNNIFRGLPGMILALLLMVLRVSIIGFANRNTANDNTSGVITLCELYLSMNAEEKSKVAFVLFDNEEKGCLGSWIFKMMHKKDNIDKQLILNFDSVSDGNKIIFSFQKDADADFCDCFRRSFVSNNAICVDFKRHKDFPMASDHKQFSHGVGVATFREHKKWQYYMTNIHTSEDNVFEKNNIIFLVDGAKRLLKEIP